MGHKSKDKKLTLLPPVKLLNTESADEFDALVDAFERDLQPQDIVECMYMNDCCHFVWQIARLRRCQASIINVEFPAAMTALLEQCLAGPAEDTSDSKDAAKNLASEWFNDEDVRETVAEILGRFKLDESAVEAEAIRRLCADLETIERMLTSFQVRRDRALGGLLEYRKLAAPIQRENSARVVERFRPKNPLKSKVM